MIYTDEELIQYLIKYYKEFGKVPSIVDMKNAVGYPSGQPYVSHFGSWNNGLIIAGFTIRKMANLKNKPNVCEICGSTETNYNWYEKDGLKVCSKCGQCNRNYIRGNLDPNCTTGIGVITEHVVYSVLEDNCIKCNTKDNFNAKYDLVSNTLGTINVKASKLRPNNSWAFCKHKSIKIPDTYICLGFNEDKSEILKVWIIPNFAPIVAKYSIFISMNNLERAMEYEVDANPYNEFYKDLNLNSLQEFKCL